MVDSRMILVTERRFFREQFAGLQNYETLNIHGFSSMNIVTCCHFFLLLLQAKKHLSGVGHQCLGFSVVKCPAAFFAAPIFSEDSPSYGGPQLLLRRP